MKIDAIDIKPGNVLERQNNCWLVLKRELVQPGKGGAFAQVELRDLRRVQNQTSVSVSRDGEAQRLDTGRKCNSCSWTAVSRRLWDDDTFEQIPIPRETIGDPADFLSEGMVCQVMLHEGSLYRSSCHPTW